MISIFLLLSLFMPTAVVGKDYFTAAVFEHRLSYENETERTPSAIVATSLSHFEKAVVLAAQKGVDIIVFNEYGLTGFPETREKFKKYAENIPDPKRHKLNPCIEKTSGRHVLHALSCLARQNNIYLVANLPDIQPCEDTCDAENIEACQTKCPEDGAYLYNTDVAFDREGNIVARHHKVYTYFEMVNAPEVPKFETFVTDFGKFGLAICFDALFKESVQLVEEYGIDTLIFSTFWLSDMIPLISSVEFQQSWALANKVNVLASNGHHASLEVMGSGIYSKEEGALVYTYEPSDMSKLLIANLRIKGDSDIPKERSLTYITENGAYPVFETGNKFPEQCYDKVVGPPQKVSDYRCHNTKTENYTLIKLEDAVGKAKSCHNGFCCELNYEAEDMREDFYLGAFNGLNNALGFHYWWEEVCIVVRCNPFEDQICALVPSTSKTIFKSASLSAEFTSERVFPLVSNSHFRLTPKIEWETFSSGPLTVIKYHNNSKKPLLKIGLYGRRYSLDPPFEPYYKF